MALRDEREEVKIVVARKKILMKEKDRGGRVRGARNRMEK